MRAITYNKNKNVLKLKKNLLFLQKKRKDNF